MKSIKTLGLISTFISLLLGVGLFVCYKYLKVNIVLPAIIYIVFVITIIIILYVLSLRKKEDIDEIVNNLSASTSLALNEGKIGILVYDENFNISFVSEMFKEKHIDRTGEKLLSWLPDLQDILNGNAEHTTVVINDDKYEVSKKSDSYALIFKDISKEYDLEKKIEDEAYVLGLCNFDNYDETNENEDTITYVNANIKIPVIEYFKEYGIVYRTLRNNRLQLILNYSKYQQLLKDRFSILNVVRKQAKNADLEITLSMAFALGYEDLLELDEQTSSLLELAQTRGGDQVVIKENGKDAIFYGGSSEARESRSKVKVRVMANTLKNLLKKANNVFIVGHIDADADCLGSMLAMATITKEFNDNVSVITESGSIEQTTKEVLNAYKKELSENINFISENEALVKTNENTVVIMCDHHSLDQTNCKTLLKQATNVAIIDHHRRKEDLDVAATLLYVEASASSTCEIVSEFFAYVPRIEISDALANFMYLGIVIDTNHFRVRTGTRTFEAARLLRNLGADPSVVEELLQEPYINVKKRTELINAAVRYTNNILITCIEKGEYPRSIASQACDTLIQTRDIAAVFVICYSESDEGIITARSKGDINVQVILEKMDGGGHMYAAGLQRKGALVTDLKTELIKNIEDYLIEKKEQENESNIVE